MRALFLVPLLVWIGLAGQAQTTVPARSVSSASKGTIKLTFLGTGAPRPSPDRMGASILVEAGGTRLLIDCGPGIRQRIFEAGNFDLLTGISHIFLTHLHYDHIADVDDVWIAGWMYGRATPLNIFGPEGTADFTANIRRAFSWDILSREVVGIPSSGNAIVAKDVRPGIVFEKDGLRITAFEVEHMPIGKGGLEGQNLGFRIDYGGRSVLFSGDVKALPHSEILKYGKNVDVLVQEVQVPSSGNSLEAKRANVSLSVHTSPAEAGYVFTATRPRMAVYSHIIPPQTSSEELSAATRPYYDGPLTTAFDLMTLTIGDQIEISRQAPQTARAFEATNVVK